MPIVRGAQERAIVQDKKSTKGLVDLLRQPEGGDAVVAYLEAMRSAKVLSEDLEDDAPAVPVASSRPGRLRAVRVPRLTAMPSMPG